MDINEKIDQIADMLDLDAGSLTPETLLEDVGWDSMGMLGVIALAKENGKTVTGVQVNDFKTVADILNAVF